MAKSKIIPPMEPNFKKLDDIDVLIFGRPTPESDRAMTAYIKAHRATHARMPKSRSLLSPHHAKPKAETKR